MADRHLLFKLAMRTLASNAGMAVTFMARPFSDTTGSSCHLHLSLVDGDGRNVFHDAEGGDGVSATLRHAIGGVLRRAPELMPFYAPTVNSYRRTTSGEFSGNGLSWGFDSRMVSCRVLTESAESTRLEWRVPGADVDPYLAIAALLASARDGIENDGEPGEPLMGAEYERPVAPLRPRSARRSNASATAHSRPRRSARTWWRTTPRPADGSGSSSCRPAPSASGNAAATSTSSEEVVS
jgi:glutamine synthetase